MLWKVWLINLFAAYYFFVNNGIIPTQFFNLIKNPHWYLSCYIYVNQKQTRSLFASPASVSEKILQYVPINLVYPVYGALKTGDLKNDIPDPGDGVGFCNIMCYKFKLKKIYSDMDSPA